jgi:hypothetical protein
MSSPPLYCCYVFPKYRFLPPHLLIKLKKEAKAQGGQSC